MVEASTGDVSEVTAEVRQGSKPVGGEKVAVTQEVAANVPPEAAISVGEDVVAGAASQAVADAGPGSSASIGQEISSEVTVKAATDALPAGQEVTCAVVGEAATDAAPQVAICVERDVGASAPREGATDAIPVPTAQAGQEVGEGVVSEIGTNAAPEPATIVEQEAVASVEQKVVASAVQEGATDAVPEATARAEQEVGASALPEVATDVAPKVAAQAGQESAAGVVVQVATDAVPEAVATAEQDVGTVQEVATDVAPKVAAQAGQESAAGVVVQVATDAVPEAVATAEQDVGVVQESATDAVPEAAAKAEQEVGTSAVPEVATDVASLVSAGQEVAANAMQEGAIYVVAEAAARPAQEVGGSAVPEVIADVAANAGQKVAAVAVTEAATDGTPEAAAGVVEETSAGAVPKAVIESAPGVAAEAGQEAAAVAVAKAVNDAASEAASGDKHEGAAGVVADTAADASPQIAAIVGPEATTDAVAEVIDSSGHGAVPEIIIKQTLEVASPQTAAEDVAGAVADSARRKTVQLRLASAFGPTLSQNSPRSGAEDGSEAIGGDRVTAKRSSVRKGKGKGRSKAKGKSRASLVVPSVTDPPAEETKSDAEHEITTTASTTLSSPPAPSQSANSPAEETKADAEHEIATTASTTLSSPPAPSQSANSPAEETKADAEHEIATTASKTLSSPPAPSQLANSPARPPCGTDDVIPREAEIAAPPPTGTMDSGVSAAVAPSAESAASGGGGELPLPESPVPPAATVLINLEENESAEGTKHRLIRRSRRDTIGVNTAERRGSRKQSTLTATELASAVAIAAASRQSGIISVSTADFEYSPPVAASQPRRRSSGTGRPSQVPYLAAVAKMQKEEAIAEEEPQVQQTAAKPDIWVPPKTSSEETPEDFLNKRCLPATAADPSTPQDCMRFTPSIRRSSFDEVLMQATQLPSFAGYLWKRSPSRLRFTSYDKRFFVLRHMTLSWWKTKEDASNDDALQPSGGPRCKGVLHLLGRPGAVEAVPKKTIFILKPVDPQGWHGFREPHRTFQFDTKRTEHTVEAWVAAISEHIRCGNRLRNHLEKFPFDIEEGITFENSTPRQMAVVENKEFVDAYTGGSVGARPPRVACPYVPTAKGQPAVARTA
eukprot:TRINITY_DN13760_c0_g1_i3.p1 TRINITY_DN13760_c0_g1~~TRINITY_DN13760_c0_g1_i3.p1  ORF type:complete len:1302 (-),score=285.30 TRINITY_DN13760_c0_g1_i3:69-3455(-)